MSPILHEQPALIGKTAVQKVARYLAGQHDQTQAATLLTTAAHLQQVQQRRGQDE